MIYENIDGTFMILEIAAWNVPPTSPIRPENTYINDKLFASTPLYGHSISKPGK